MRTSLFVSGCRNCCKNCFNKETWDFCFGKPYTEETEKEILDSLSFPFVNGLSVLGGEPFEPENQPEIFKLIKKVKELYPAKTVWVYSGFTFEEITGGSRAATETAKEILKIADILVDGRFIEELKNISLEFRGSENQRIIDLKKTLNDGKITTRSKINE